MIKSTIKTTIIFITTASASATKMRRGRQENQKRNRYELDHQACLLILTRQPGMKRHARHVRLPLRQFHRLSLSLTEILLAPSPRLSNINLFMLH
jgi:hypothetical protein